MRANALPSNGITKITVIVRHTNRRMETTFDKFITNNAKQKALFDEEYAEFSRSESALKNLEEERQTKPAVVKSKTRHKRYIPVE